MTVPAEIAYVAACALGLGFSQHRGAEAIEELAHAAGGCPERLDAARAVLAGYPSEDPSVRREASELLLAAATALRSRETAGRGTSPT